MRVDVRGLDLLRTVRVEGIIAPLAPFVAEEECEVGVGGKRDGPRSDGPRCDSGSRGLVDSQQRYVKCFGLLGARRSGVLVQERDGLCRAGFRARGGAADKSKARQDEVRSSHAGSLVRPVSFGKLSLGAVGGSVCTLALVLSGRRPPSLYALLASLGALSACDPKPQAPVRPTEVVADGSSAREALPPETIREAPEPGLASRQHASPTQLLNPGPSPQPSGDSSAPAGMVPVTYASEGKNLKGWLHRGQPGAPVLVYLHGGFAGDASEAYACPQFAEAGYSVLVPTYRGENGNPGSFELLFGEVRDAAAAVRYAQTIEGVDSDRIVVFGHSAGAAVSALVAGMDDVPARMTGGAGGFYDPVLVESFMREFGVATPLGNELILRTPSLVVNSMRIRHHAFVGSEDDAVGLGGMLGWLQSRGDAKHPLRVYDVPGDHFESLVPACAAFFELAEGRVPVEQPRSSETLDSAGLDPQMELFEGTVGWGGGPFDEPESPGPKLEPVRVGQWEIGIPVGAVVKTSQAGGLTTLAFETEALRGEFSVGDFPPEVRAKLKPINVMFNILMSYEPSAARFFVVEEGAVGLEVRGQKNGRRAYTRAGLLGATFVSLDVWPADAVGVNAVVRSVGAAGE